MNKWILKCRSLFIYPWTLTAQEHMRVIQLWWLVPETLGAADLDLSVDTADRAVTAHYIIAVKKKISQFIPGSKTGCQSKHSNQSKRAEALFFLCLKETGGRKVEQKETNPRENAVMKAHGWHDKLAKLRSNAWLMRNRRWWSGLGRQWEKGHSARKTTPKTTSSFLCSKDWIMIKKSDWQSRTLAHNRHF